MNIVISKAVLSELFRLQQKSGYRFSVYSDGLAKTSYRSAFDFMSDARELPYQVDDSIDESFTVLKVAFNGWACIMRVDRDGFEAVAVSPKNGSRHVASWSTCTPFYGRTMVDLEYFMASALSAISMKGK